MLGEITHLQPIVDDLTALTEDPHKLPPASEQVTIVQPSSHIGLCYIYFLLFVLFFGELFALLYVSQA